MSHTVLVDARVWKLLLDADRELAVEARTRGCSCGGRLHSARYPRKPRRGVPLELREEYRWRESLCCEREGCRRRTTPESLRFLGRCVYLGALVVLVSAMTGGVTERRAAAMRALVGVTASARCSAGGRGGSRRSPKRCSGERPGGGWHCRWTRGGCRPRCWSVSPARGRATVSWPVSDSWLPSPPARGTRWPCRLPQKMTLPRPEPAL